MTVRDSILLIDDDAGFLQVAQTILKAKGFLVEAAPTAADALAMAKNQFYNVAIVDIGLPDGNGTDLLSPLLKLQPDILPIMLTGHSSVENAVQSVNRGAFAYLEKPLDPKKLLSTINRGLEKQRLLMENKRLVQELEQHNRETGIMLEVSQAISQTLDLKQIINSALKKVVRCFNVDAAYLHIYKEDKLALDGYNGFPEELKKKIHRISRDNLTADMIYDKIGAVMINHIAGNKDHLLSSLSTAGYHTYAAIPLMYGGEVLGILAICTIETREYTSSEVELFRTIGREIGSAVKNVELYEDASAARALREMDAMRTELLATVSHELRTPLASIKGFASSLLQPDVCFDEETRRSFLQTIDCEADRLNRLIEELLMMSRLDAGTLEVRRKSCTIKDVVDSIRDRLYNLTLKHHLFINIPDKLPVMLIDEIRIGEVVTNLIENAVKYSKEGTEIELKSEKVGNTVVTTVADKGSGIAPEYHDKIFERFFQVSRKEGRRQGTGLGLSICRGIVGTHGGRIWVESEPGKGACFIFSLPIEQGDDNG